MSMFTPPYLHTSTLLQAGTLVLGSRGGPQASGMLFVVAETDFEAQVCARGVGGGIWGNFSIMRRVRPTVGHRGGRPYPGA